MTQEYIKKIVKDNCLRIKRAEERLAKIRSICEHPNTFEGLYSWRVGSMYNAIICSDCGTMIKNLDIPKNPGYDR